MPRGTRRASWIEWRKSDARQIVLDDLESELLPLDEDEMSAEAAWEVMYSHMVEFAAVPFDQFKARLTDHRKQRQRKVNANDRQLAAFYHDLGIHPAQEQDQHGNRVFVLSDAYPLLQQDIQADRHLVTSITNLHGSRDEYLSWPLRIFVRRVRQEVKRQKFIYYLSWKRAMKEYKRGGRNADTYDSEEESDDTENGGDDDEEDGDEVDDEEVNDEDDDDEDDDDEDDDDEDDNDYQMNEQNLNNGARGRALTEESEPLRRQRQRR